MDKTNQVLQQVLQGEIRQLQEELDRRDTEWAAQKQQARERAERQRLVQEPAAQ